MLRVALERWASDDDGQEITQLTFSPDGNQVATPRPAVVHHETDTFLTTYTAIDPPHSASAAVALDGFFGWPLTTVAS